MPRMQQQQPQVAPPPPVKRALRLGDKWFVVSQRWWAREVLGGGSGGRALLGDSDAELSDGDDDPRARRELLRARIHNEPLVDRARSCRCCSRSLLRPGLVEGVDFRLVSERVWRALALEFGYDWQICRPVVSKRAFRGPTELCIDLYPAGIKGHQGSKAPEYPLEVEDGSVDEDGDENMEPEQNGTSGEQWRQELEVGSTLDALDTDKKWYEARVIGANEEQVKVHYRGWSTRWDEWIARDSPRLMPLHTKVRDWRKFSVDDRVQIGVPVPGKRHLEWRDASVLSTINTLLVQLQIEGGGVEWVDAQDERLCPPGTHRVHSKTSSPSSGRGKRVRTANGEGANSDA